MNLNAEFTESNMSQHAKGSNPSWAKHVKRKYDTKTAHFTTLPVIMGFEAAVSPFPESTALCLFMWRLPR